MLNVYPFKSVVGVARFTFYSCPCGHFWRSVIFHVCNMLIIRGVAKDGLLRSNILLIAPQKTVFYNAVNRYS